jgi:hypothetical protein
MLKITYRVKVIIECEDGVDGPGGLLGAISNSGGDDDLVNRERFD